MSEATNYIFVSIPGSKPSYQVKDIGLLEVFNGSLAAPHGEIPISYTEAKTLFAKPITRQSFWQRCNVMYAQKSKSRRKKEPELPYVQQIELSDMINAAQATFNRRRKS